MKFQSLSPSHYPFLTNTMRSFWQQHGAEMAALLRPETAVSLAEVCTAYRECLLDHPENGIEVDEAYVAWVLVKLAEYGLIRVVTDVASVTTPVVLADTRPVYRMNN